MVKFGICMPLADREAVAAARESGWEYAEDSATNLLQGLNADDTAWTGPRMVHRSPLPNLVCNGLVPASMKITGVRADPFAVHGYLETVFRRAGELGIGTLVFGSGAARAIPDEFDRSLGMRQIIDFLEVATGLAARHDVTIALEHLHEGETNVLNSLAECVAVARSLSHPRLKVMLDTYHLWTSDEPVDHVRDALPVLAHVHLADLAGRVAPGESGPGDSSDYRELFRVLKRGGYSGTMSVEALGFESHAYARVLEFVRAQWQA